MTSDAPIRCAWCAEVATTDVVTRSGRKNKKTAPVCEAHALQFERQGVMTTRLELDQKLERERKRSQWLKGRRPWR